MNNNSRRRIAEDMANLESDEPLLTEQDKEIIRTKAKTHVRDKRKADAEEAFLKAAIVEQERTYEPDDQFEDILIELAPFVASQKFNASFIALDGKRFFQGMIYTVPVRVARTLQDIMARGWEHEREIHGEPRRAISGMRPIGGHLTPQNAAVINSTAALRRNTNA